MLSLSYDRVATMQRHTAAGHTAKLHLNRRCTLMMQLVFVLAAASARLQSGASWCQLDRCAVTQQARE